MDKKSFRKLQLQRLQEFAHSGHKQQVEERLTALFFADKTVQQAQSFGLTIGENIEFNTWPIIVQLLKEHKKIYLAKVTKNHEMNFLRYTTDTSLVRSSFGVLEVDGPSEVQNQLDLLIVPGLAFEREHHYRLGFGGGHYDRFMAKYQTKALALAMPPMLYDNAMWPVETFDRPIDRLIK